MREHSATLCLTLGIAIGCAALSAASCRNAKATSAESLQAPSSAAAQPARPSQSPAAANPSAPSGARIPSPAAEADDSQWPRPARDYASTRYSELADITAFNVKNLKLAWTFSTGVLHGHEAAPIIVGSTMYVVTPFPNVLYALDLSKPGAPVKWSYKPKPAGSAKGIACCDVVNRGAVFSNGRIFFNTLDGYTIAIDADSGKEAWKTPVADMNKGETITMAPLVAKGKVLVGNSGGEMGVRGCVTALDERDGTIAWRAYSTGPDKDVLIGPEFKPFYKQDQGTDLGVHTWPADAWKIGGGTMWGWISYDPELNLIYHGTANPGPWNPDQRPGDNKWTCGIFARNPDTGAARWFYQFTPHDQQDYDGINENILLDITWQGQPRKVLVRPERNGYMYVLDRATGEVLSAAPYVTVTTSTGVDLSTGRLKHNPETKPRVGVVVKNMCPAAPGAKDWQPSSFSPRTGWLYVPHQNLCEDMEGVEANYIAGTPYVGANVKMYAEAGKSRGELMAWDPIEGAKKWVAPENFPVWSGTVATAGDLVFYGTMDGWFRAVDARSGQLLWQFKVGSGIVGQPVTYRGPDGRQYVAVLSGVGGWSGAIVAGGLDPRDPSGALGFVNAMKDLPQHTTMGGMLYVFSL